MNQSTTGSKPVNTTNPIEDHEGVSNGSEHNSDTVTNLTVNGWAAECPKPANDAKPWNEVSHVSSNCPNDSDELEVQSEVVRRAGAYPTYGSQLAAGTGRTTKPVTAKKPPRTRKDRLAVIGRVARTELPA